MTLYFRIPNLKFHEECWGGLVKLPSGRIVSIDGLDIFNQLQKNVSFDIDDLALPKNIRELIDLGLIVEQKSTYAAEAIDKVV
jgi:hypothetical protein